MLAVYTGETLHLEPGRAAFLVSAKATGVDQLESVLQADTTQTMLLTYVDDEFVEVSLKGTWIANSANADAGTFITALTPVIEALIYQLWQVTQRQIAFSL